MRMPTRDELKTDLRTMWWGLDDAHRIQCDARRSKSSPTLGCRCRTSQLLGAQQLSFRGALVERLTPGKVEESGYGSGALGV